MYERRAAVEEVEDRPWRRQTRAAIVAVEDIQRRRHQHLCDPVTQWTAREERAGRSLTMWMVMRDDRGGVDWTSRQVNVAK